jgi:uncharacterized protein (TIGR02757 family)
MSGAVARADGRLKRVLDGLVRESCAGGPGNDPLEFARRYSDPLDREIVGFIAAFLALGRVESIHRTLDRLLEKMGPSPSRRILDFDPDSDRSLYQGFVYRFYSGRDMGLLLSLLRQIMVKKGGLKSLFLSGFCSRDRNIGPSLSRFVRALLELDMRPFYPALPEKGQGIRHFFADPEDGSPCKRLNLFLRWMVRKDNLDLGLWTEIPASRLVIPLDTHVRRIGSRLGFTDLASASWAMAEQITDSLRRFDPDDPVKYDFAICHLGMNRSCPELPDRKLCSSCPVVAFCRMCGSGNESGKSVQ